MMMRRDVVLMLLGWLVLSACSSSPPARSWTTSPPASPSPALSPSPANAEKRSWEALRQAEARRGHRLTKQDRATGVTVYHSDGADLPEGAPPPILEIEGEGGYLGPLTDDGLLRIGAWLDELHGEAGR